MSDVLIDTQALIWYADGSQKLSDHARRAIDDSASNRFASAATIWEMAIKISLGKLILRTGSLQEFAGMLAASQIEILPVTADVAVRIVDLPLGEHRDPFDRLLTAQCLERNLTIVSSDRAFEECGVRRIW